MRISGMPWQEDCDMQTYIGAGGTAPSQTRISCCFLYKSKRSALTLDHGRFGGIKDSFCITLSKGDTKGGNSFR